MNAVFKDTAAQLREELVSRREFISEAMGEELGDEFYAAVRNFESLAMGQFIQRAIQDYADKHIATSQRDNAWSEERAIRNLLRCFQ